LTVVAAGPRGDIALDNDPAITIVFNRPMRSLEASVTDHLPNVSIRTASGEGLDGHFRFIGTRGLIFQPTARLKGATRYEVRIPSGTKAADGSQLPKDFVFDFSTPRPILRDHFPKRPIRPEESWFLQFTQPIDPLELQKHLTVLVEVKGQKLGRPIAVTVQRAAPAWLRSKTAQTPPSSVTDLYTPITSTPNESGLWFQITPTSPVPLDSELKVMLSSGLVSMDGPLPTLTPQEITYHSYGPLRLSNLNCARQNLGRCQAHRDFTAVLTNPVHPEEFRRFLRIEGPMRPVKPERGKKAEAPKISEQQFLRLDPEFGDQFRVTLKAGMSDIFGQKLAKDITVDLAIEEPFRLPGAQGVIAPTKPKVDENSAEEMGEREYDQVPSVPDKKIPTRPILQYGLELGVTGHILEAKVDSALRFHSAQRAVPISSINVPTYGLYTSKLSEWSTIQWLNGKTRETLATPFVWITPVAPKNTRAVKSLTVSNLLEGASTGTTAISLLGLGQYTSESTLLNVTDLGISAKVSRFGSLVWVTRLSTGVPAAEVDVSIFDSNGNNVATGKTDATGLARFTERELKAINKTGAIDSSLLLVARANEDFTYQRLAQAQTTSGMGDTDYAQKAAWLGLVFTDRNVYRPGEIAKVGGFFRKTAEKGLSVKPGQDYQYQVVDAAYETVAVGEGKLDEFGALSQEIHLSRTCAYGGAQLIVKLGHDSGESFTSSFEVLAYKPAEFKVAVTSTERDYVHRQSANFKIAAEYLYGAPLAEGRVIQRVSRQEIDYAPPNSRGYVVSDFAFLSDLRYTNERGSAYSQESKLLDGSGLTDSRILLNAPQQLRTESLEVEAEVQDISGQTQSSRSSVLVHPALYYLGLQQPKKRFLAVGAMAPVALSAFNPTGDRMGSVPVTIELWRRSWVSVLEDRPADILHHQTHVRDEKLGDCAVSTLATGDSGKECRLRVGEEGYYLLRSTSKDALGNEIHSSIGFYAVSNRADEKAVPVTWQSPDRRELSLELDQTQYQPGDVAQILVKSPFMQATALVTVERGGILTHQIVPLKGRMPVVEVPVKDEYYPNAFVSVHLVRGRVAKIPLPGQADVGAPDYRIGYAKLVVNPESRRLKIDVETKQKDYRPGDEVESKVTLRRPDGKPTAGTVTFYVVDEGVLRLTGYKTPDPLPAFAIHRSLGVFPVESRDNLARILAFRPGETISPLGYERQGNSNDKGDEVGGGDESSPGRLRSDFRTTVYFNSGATVDESGQIKFRFKLPDNLTAFRMMAVAAGREDRFGFGESTITSSKQLMARPALPRILRVGDVVDAGLVVSTKGLPPLTASVSLKANQGKTTKNQSQSVTVAPTGQSMVRFPLTIEKPGDVSFEFSATSGKLIDRVLVTRPSTEPTRRLSASVYGTTSKPLSVALGNLGGYRSDVGQLTVTLSNSALVGVKSVFDELATYPYGCTEQLSSRALPLLLAEKLALAQNVRLSATQSSSIDSMLSEISKRQQPNGGLGFWEGDNTESPWLTAYGFLALETGSRAGYFVPKQQRDRLANYLLQYLDRQLTLETTRSRNSVGSSTEDDETPKTTTESTGENDADPEDGGEGNNGLQTGSQSEHPLSPRDARTRDLGQACFVANILARTGQLDESRLQRLRLSTKAMPLSARIQVLHAMAKLRLGRQELDLLLKDILREVTVGPAEAKVASVEPLLSGLLESQARSTAILLEAVLEIDKNSTLAPKLVRGLLSMRKGASYNNTQENAWVLMALEAYRKVEQGQAKDFATEVFLDDESLGHFNFLSQSPKNESAVATAAKLLDGGKTRVTLAPSGEGTLSYAVELSLAKTGASEIAFDEGLSIEKLVRAISPNALTEAAKRIPEHSETSAKLGDLVLVDLLVETAEPRERLVIDDPLPAGLEPVDFAFDTSSRALSVVESASAESTRHPNVKNSSYGRLQPLTGLHREMKDDRVTYFISSLSPGIYHLRYLARATSSGRFVVPPTRVESMYDPTIFGQTKATQFTVALPK
jgi:uncharacterized protein YfaS (alpha-2-macroglobulin family)